MSKITIIDGDSLIYTAAFRCQETQHQEGGWSRIVVTKSEREARAEFDAVFSEIVKNVGDGSYVLYLTDGAPCYRYSCSKTRKYKGNRDNSAPPIHYRNLRQFVLDARGGIVEFGEEADDLVSVHAHECRRNGDSYVIVGHDKDLNQIPGWHYNWYTGERYEVSEHEARVFFWMQVLMGDPGDNIGGIWKTGFKKAKSFVQEWISKDNLSDAEIYSLVCDEFEKSKKLPGCPYKSIANDLLTHEAYWLVHLKTTKDDMPSWLKSEKRINGETSTQKEGREASTSHYAGLAAAPG